MPLPVTRPPLLVVVLVAVALAACSRAGSIRPVAPPVRFIENDYARALSEARIRGVPLFIDAWAPWCHTCLSMRAFVFTDDRLDPISPRFVWLSVDTERDENAELVARLGVRVLPTLFVLDARDERVTLAWPGSLTAPELVSLLDDTRSGTGPRGPLAVDALVMRYNEDGRLSECVTLAADEAPKMPPGTALADVLRSGMECAERLPAGAPQRRLTDLAALGAQVASDPSQPILADDRSDLYDHVVGAYRALGRDKDATRLARAWTSFLEAEAARAPSPSARAVFDAHRLLAYVALDEPRRAIPMLEQSEADFPGDYNPPARLAAAYLATRQYDAALAASRRALARAYGPRKLRLWSLQADVLVAKGDTAGARASLRAAIDFAHRLTRAESYRKQVETIQRRLDEM